MNRLYSFLFLTFAAILLLAAPTVQAQSHADPAYLQVVSAENPIVVDGVLDEEDWLKRFDYLVFGFNAEAGDVAYTVTDGLTVKETYPDSSTTIVKVLHHGLDLYISLDSDDKSVGKFGTSWEGDGLFMKIKNASGVDVEYKMFWNLNGVDPDIAVEGLDGTYEGAAFKKEGTIVNDITADDAGYTAEMVIHLDQLGYTDPYAEVPVLFNIFDPDGYTDDLDPWGEVGGYYKQWWGSEWGPDMKTLKLSDPLSLDAYATEAAITLDGQLNEDFWSGANSVVIGKGSGSSTGGYYQQWNSEVNTYEDQSVATVKFIHNGTDLYIGVESDDKSVCAWVPSWEADGLFLWMTNKGDKAPALRMEIKNMFFDQTEGALCEFQVNGNVPTGGAEGASYVPEGTVTHTETNGEDAGYSLEVVVHTDLFGYSVGDEVFLSAVIWDVDKSSADAYDADVADYAPHWWGTQWADPNFEKYHMYRGVVLSDEAVTDVDDEYTNELVYDYKLMQNYPNPFNPTTVINYTLPEKSDVVLKIYNILGMEVATLANQVQNAGSHEVTFNAAGLPSGVYIYSLQVGSFTQTRKMLLLK